VIEGVAGERHMKISFRRIAKWGLWTLAVVGALFGLYLSVFFFPYPLFPQHLEASGFDLYSDGEIPPDYEDMLRDARIRLEAMELYRNNDAPRIFVCASHELFDFIVRLAGKRFVGQGLLISVAGNAFFSQEMVAEVGRRHGGRPMHSRLQGSLAAAIAHEAAHDLVFTEVGFKNARRLPVWKSEGYADYQANKAAIDGDPNYDLRARISYLLDEDSWPPPTGFVDRRHFRWQLQVEFLCGVQGMGFHELMDRAISEEQSRDAMIRWYGNRVGAER
jgi:hypothetical protein